MIKEGITIPKGYFSKDASIGEKLREYITPIHLQTIQSICSDITKQSEEIKEQFHNSFNSTMSKEDVIPTHDYILLKNFINELHTYMKLLEEKATL